MSSLFLPKALLPEGWDEDVLVDVNTDGTIAGVAPRAACPPGAERLQGAAIPGIPNLHSHAHQRAMAGLAERSGAGDDGFWSWREAMYRALDRLDPDGLEAVASLLY